MNRILVLNVTSVLTALVGLIILSGLPSDVRGSEGSPPERLLIESPQSKEIVSGSEAVRAEHSFGQQGRSLLSDLLAPDVRFERRFLVLHQREKVFDIQVHIDEYTNVSMQLASGIIEFGNLDEETLFLAVVPTASESFYIEIPKAEVNGLASESQFLEILSSQQKQMLINALDSMKHELEGLDTEGLELAYVQNGLMLQKEKFADSSFGMLARTCNEAACGAAILALDVAIILAVVKCAGTLGLGCLAGAGTVAAAASAVALACEGCGE